MPTDNVVVVGAGPTGLMIAGDLAAAGIATTLIERHAHGSELTRAFVLHARTLEELEIRGVADQLVKQGKPVDILRLFGKITVDFSDLPTKYPYVLVAPQYLTEAVLEERAVKAGVEVARGVEVTGLTQEADQVTVNLANGDTRTAAYVVGADGHRSTVRNLIGQPFPGKTVISSVMLADVQLAQEPPQQIATNAVGRLFFFLAPFGDGYYRAIAWNSAHTAAETDPVDLGEMKSIARAVLGTDYGMHDPRWSSRFHCDERQVPQYRVGRAFLVGDAAHEHSPAGGQGMNTGLQDSANLGWKLAQALRGGPDLLDTYHDERHPVGARVIAGSGVLLRAAQFRFSTLRDLVVGPVLHLHPILRQLQFAASGLGVSYPAPEGAHRRIGRRAPDVLLEHSHVRAGVEPNPAKSLYQALRPGRFVLLDDGSYETVAQQWAGRVDMVRSADYHPPHHLVRPDGYIAWAADTPSRGKPAQLDELRAALTTWCGPAN